MPLAARTNAWTCWGVRNLRNGRGRRKRCLEKTRLAKAGMLLGCKRVRQIGERRPVARRWENKRKNGKGNVKDIVKWVLEHHKVREVRGYPVTAEEGCIGGKR